jgi:Holliday junction resolvase RusA-like endonuclease
MTPITFFVPGQPAVQGNRRMWVQKLKSGKLVALSKERNAEALHDWHAAVAAVGMRFRPAAIERVALAVTLVFAVRRPKGHYKATGGLNRQGLTSPWPNRKRGDMDKLERAVLDALTTAGVYADDGDVVVIRKAKMWTEGAIGAYVGVQGADERPLDIDGLLWRFGMQPYQGTILPIDERLPRHEVDPLPTMGDAVAVAERVLP